MHVRNILRNMFGLDWRSLALMRIGLALVILLDLAVSAQNLRVFYSDEGVLPTQVVRDNYAPDFTLHLASGSVGYEAGLFAIEAVFALMMLVGYRTRLATVGCWFMLMSRQARNPIVLFGADMIEHIAMFWAMLLPLNRRYSVDAWLGRVQQAKDARYLSLTSFGVVLQFLLIYIVSGMLKTGDTWRVNHTAVYFSLAEEMYARPLGQWLNQFDWLTAWLTIGTLYLELYGPLLFILPFRWGWGRLLGFGLFGALQVGFGITMQMGLFWVVMNAFMLMLLPEEFWTWLAEPVGRWLAKRLPLPKRRQEDKVTPNAFQFAPTGWRWSVTILWRGAWNAVILAIIVYMILLNYDTLPGHTAIIPDNWRRPATDSGLDQKFDMFAPTPETDDGWFVLRGWKKDGEAVDVRTGNSPPSFEHPDSVAETYGDERWGSYLLDLSYSEYSPYRQYFAWYLAREWNAAHPGNQQLTSLEIIYMHEVHGPYHAVGGPNLEVLWAENF